MTNAGTPNVDFPKMPSWAPKQTFATPEDAWLLGIRAALQRHPRTNTHGDAPAPLADTAGAAPAVATSGAESLGAKSSSSTGDVTPAEALRDVAMHDCSLPEGAPVPAAFVPIPPLTTGTGVIAVAVARDTGKSHPLAVAAAAVVLALMCAATAALLWRLGRQRRLAEARGSDSAKVCVVIRVINRRFQGRGWPVPPRLIERLPFSGAIFCA